MKDNMKDNILIMKNMKDMNKENLSLIEEPCIYPPGSVTQQAEVEF